MVWSDLPEAGGVSWITQLAGCGDPFRSASDWITAPGLGGSDGQLSARAYDKRF
jgi:hypothetical protein